MNINIDFLITDLINSTVPKPLSGTTSGHAAGEPFDKHVYSEIKKKYPNDTFRQFEYLNSLYSNNPKAVTVAQRFNLMNIKSLGLLINRGKDSTKNWTTTNPFEEKQNDTADIIVVKDLFFNIVDVKTYNIVKAGQPPNIISAFKIANMCALMLEQKLFKTHSIIYVGITWELDATNLKCTEVSIKQLFKTNPSNLYINWAAAMQIQFHVGSLPQDYGGEVEQWCKDYLRMFVAQAKERSTTMITKFVNPFMKLLE